MSTSTSRFDAYVSTSNGFGGPLLSLSVSREGIPRDSDGQRWAWRVRIVTDDVDRTFAGDDLRTGAWSADHENSQPRAALQALHSFAEAWVESVEYAERNGTDLADTNAGDLFPREMFDLLDDWEPLLFGIGCEIGAYADGES